MRGFVAVLVTSLVMLGGCGPGPMTTSTPAASPVSTAPTATASITPASSASADMVTLLERVAGAQHPAGSELDEVWRSILADVTHRGASSYAAPARVVAYRGGEVPDSACSRGTAARDWTENAFYCSQDRSIFYDEDWFTEFSAAIGTFAPGAIIAHEWGHHIQNVLGYPELSLQTELQADCFAGLFLANTIEALPGAPGSDTELVDALRSFFELGNKRYDSSLWFRPREHGSQQQRMRAFMTGADASFKSPGLPPPAGLGIATCYGYRDFQPKDYTDLTPYRLLNMPGRSEIAAPGGVAIQPETRVGIATSTVLLEWLPGGTQEIMAAVATRFPGLTTSEPTIPLDANVAPGTGFANYAVQTSPSLAGGARNGMLAVIEPAAGGGALLLFVYRDGPGQSTEAAALQQLAEQIALQYELIARLCGPDDSDHIGDQNLTLACLVEQQ